MGTYINIGNAGFQSARNGEYVDKSGLIAIINGTLFTERRFSCVSRCRRFGKSMAAKMLYAYYDKSCDSRSLFADLEIARDPLFEKHLNKYPVIYLDLSDFVTRFKDETIVRRMDVELTEDLHKAYSDVPVEEDDDLMKYLIRIVEAKNQQFIFIIDEWDAICREFKAGTKAMDEYVDWLRRLFKGGRSSDVFAGVYMTGILPIKKYKTESALNNFIEYSMVTPRKLAQFFGFTKEEVRALAEKDSMDYDELEKWYDGYQVGDQPSMFNPNSVIQAIDSEWCESYVTKAIRQSEQLLQATLRGDEEAVALGVDAAHDEHTSILSYNDENSLACVLSLAYYYANNDYVIHRKLATGKAAIKREQNQACLSFTEREHARTESKGFADLVMIPRKNVESPAIVLELKYNQDADTAIDQILRKQYPAKVAEYTGDLLLVGINYDKQQKTHQCRIVKIDK